MGDAEWLKRWFVKGSQRRLYRCGQGCRSECSLQRSHHLPAQVPLSVQVSTSEGAALNALELTVMPRQTLYFPWELHKHSWVTGGALCQTPEYDLENLSSVLCSPGMGQCLSTGWVGCSQPVLPAQGSLSPVWFPGLKS